MKKNILLKLDNINQHFTEKNKIILFVSGIILFGSINTSPTSALEYQNSQLVSFSIDPTVNITISDNLTIPSLSPGDGKDSNIITVTASSNSIAGYTLSSSVGSTSNPSTELRKDGTSTTHKFDSITTNKSSLSDFNGNDWGYSYSTDSGTTWQSGDITGTPATGYNGLPLYTTETPIKLINSTDASTNSIQFKIGAKATSTQVAGEYTNVINFIGVANDNPNIVYMQDATLADCGKTMVDSRDNNVYSTALVGDRCWMTTNLNLLGGTKLTHNNTDMSAEYEEQGLPTANGFLSGNRLPESSTVGFDDDAKAFVYNSGNATSNCSIPGCYSYYSWTAATIGSGLNISTSDTDAPYSICPKGWHLPNTRSGIDSTSDFRALAIALGGSANVRAYDGASDPDGTTMVTALQAMPNYYLTAGNYRFSSFENGNTLGRYWSATVSNNNMSRILYYGSGFANFADVDLYRYGSSVRCVLDQ